MQVPLELICQGVQRTPELEAFVRDRVARLERHGGGLISCHVTVGKSRRRHEPGSGWRVRLQAHLPQRKELVVVKDTSSTPGPHGQLSEVIHSAFDALRRQLGRQQRRLKQEVKVHPARESQAHIAKLFDDHGFLRDLEDRTLYFHRNSVVGFPFEALEIGMGVAFAEEKGREGIQASSIRVVEPELTWARPLHRP